MQDEYYCPITSDDPVLKGWDEGAKEVSNMVRSTEALDAEGEVVSLAKTGKKLSSAFLNVYHHTMLFRGIYDKLNMLGT